MKLFICSLLLPALFINHSWAGSKVRSLKLSEKSVPTIPISSRGAVISFPTKPTNVILGAKGSFGIEYVKSDLAISPMNSAARSNLFVYLEGRRFNLELVSSVSGYTLVIIDDTENDLVRVEDE